jgi:hypothetical protein
MLEITYRMNTELTADLFDLPAGALPVLLTMEQPQDEITRVANVTFVQIAPEAL